MNNVSNKFTQAKPGELFMDSLANTMENHGQPRVLVFHGLVDTNSDYPQVKFIDRETGKELLVNADDRYGLYPRLDGKQLKKIVDRRAQLAAELSKYDYLLAQCNDFTYPTSL